MTAGPGMARAAPAPSGEVAGGLGPGLPPAAERIRIYVWEVPVRVAHWLTVGSIVVLSTTGAYIADPFLLPVGDGTMRTARFIHMVAAYAFLAALVLRAYWFFAGNRFARWQAFIPTNRRHLHELVAQGGWYLFLRRELPIVVGHNALAAGTYTVVYILFAIQVVTGFGLAAVHGTEPWAALFGWVPAVMFGEQGMRLVHHLVMWAILAFLVHHVYAALLIDRWERNGLLSSMFSGYKFVPRWRIEAARDGGVDVARSALERDVAESLAEAHEAGVELER